ncbi:predicted protein [Uncinocarpus reesii 1704]|uniref:Smr domain-containing protein n=1 Tax=Uncinocarpus reesii (strain UAMH 1704) TaxID=336963 RepID=C4JGJ9_UNCRE|nr:uncharacterized protein UREG_01190 [Uncinocarpus reesii 1704]EEP76341.1 predicted protein [Uncinocarpus reesii 1704]
MADFEAIGVLEELENEYCPPLDPALFAAIAHDYNLEDDDVGSIKALRDTLDELKVLAAAQENCDFDPSGTSGNGALEEDGAASELSVPPSHRTLRSLETNITSLESSLSSLSVEKGKPTGKRKQPEATAQSGPTASNLSQRGAAFSGLGLEEKKVYLNEMFPSIDQFTISHTLGKCDGDVDRSMDVLLNLAFFEDSNNYNSTDANDDRISIPKGVEGFEEGTNHKTARRKGKGKRSKAKQMLEQSISTCAEADLNRVNIDNKWDNGKKDVDFICSRTHLSMQAVNSAYHLNSAHLPTTIHYLARKEIEKNSNIMDDPVTIEQIAELHEEFSTVPSIKLAGLLQMARNSISAANELARVMVTEPEIPVINMKLNLTPPISTQMEYTPVRKNQKTASPLPNSRDAGISFGSSRILADHHRRAGETAFNKAQVAYRRGKSDHLMGAAASYYSDLGRKHIEIARRETSAAADALVDSQSRGTVLDLHGVSVQDGVRIACERVEDWWESLGDAKYAPGGGGPVRQGFRIITGLGRHSKNGTAKLGPAVASRLAKEGWRVEVAQGHLTVTGLVRHR